MVCCLPRFHGFHKIAHLIISVSSDGSIGLGYANQTVQGIISVLRGPSVRGSYADEAVIPVVFIDCLPANGICLFYQVSACIILIGHLISGIVRCGNDTVHGIILVNGQEPGFIAQPPEAPAGIITHDEGIPVRHGNLSDIAFLIHLIEVFTSHGVCYLAGSSEGILFICSLSLKRIRYLNDIPQGVMLDCCHVPGCICLGQELPQHIVMVIRAVAIGICFLQKISVQVIFMGYHSSQGIGHLLQPPRCIISIGGCMPFCIGFRYPVSSPIISINRDSP